MELRAYRASIVMVVILILVAPFIARADVISSGTKTITGTFGFDFDAGVLSNLHTDPGTDVFWEQYTSDTRSLNPVNHEYPWYDNFAGKPRETTMAAIGLIGATGFAALTLDDLKSLSYGTAGIDGSDGSNVLVQGFVFAVKTGAGNFAKVLVTGQFDDNYNHGLPIQWVTYSGTEPITIDIKPGSCPNPLNVKSKGVFPLAVLGTEDFDVSTIDPATIRLFREGVDGEVPPLRWSYEDVGTPFEGELCVCHALKGDGYIDLSLKFDMQELIMTLQLGEVKGKTFPLILTGNLKEEFGGTSIEGQDCMWVLDKAK